MYEMGVQAPDGYQNALGQGHKYSTESLTLNQYRQQFGDIEGFGQYAEEMLKR